LWLNSGRKGTKKGGGTGGDGKEKEHGTNTLPRLFLTKNRTLVKTIAAMETTKPMTKAERDIAMLRRMIARKKEIQRETLEEMEKPEVKAIYEHLKALNRTEKGTNDC
jgi:hypothetical protein